MRYAVRAFSFTLWKFSSVGWSLVVTKMTSGEKLVNEEMDTVERLVQNGEDVACQMAILVFEKKGILYCIESAF